jgi:hypothetical protein
MSAKSFYVSHEGHQQGPLSLDEIVAKVKAGELTPLDYLFDDAKNDWVVFLEHSALAARIQEHKPKTPPKPSPVPHAPSAHEQQLIAKKVKEVESSGAEVKPDMVAEWFVLKGENKFGPFAYADLIKMLQQKVVYEFDFVWHTGLSGWKRIAELSCFDNGHIKKLKDTSMPDISDIFFRRRHRRVAYNGTIIIHDNKSVWKGEGVEISSGGAGVVMENSMLVPGQTLYLHFKPGDGVPPFNAICEVVSKKFVEGVKDKTAPIRYGLKFTSISPSAQKFIQEFTKQKLEAA